MYSWIVPMQSARMTTKQKLENMYPCGFWAETKLDGWRCELRKVGDVIQLFTRTGKEYTEIFRSIIDTITVDKLLTVDNCVVDGEILAWHKVRRAYGLCSSLLPTALGTRDPTGDDSNVQLVIRLWDVMHINDEQIMGLPLEIRRKRLRKIVTNTDVLRVVEPLKLDGECLLYTWADMTRLLKEAMDRNDEGLVLKDPASMYKPGTRKITGGWIKIKPDYLTNTSEYDVLIVGAGGGKYKPAGDFLVAIAEDPPAGGTPDHFHTLAHIGGMNDKEKGAVNEILRGHMVFVDFSSKTVLSKQNTTLVTFKRMNVGSEHQYAIATWAATASLQAVQVCYKGGKREGCNWVFDPRFSVIITVKADFRVIPTKTFSMTHTLRFARLHEKGLRVHRPDLGINGDPKSWWDCMRVSEWGPIVESSRDPATTTRVLGGFDKISSTKRVKPSPQVQVGQSVRKYYGNSEKHPDGPLANHVIHVLQCGPEQQKELEEMAAGMGAHVVSADPDSGKVCKTFDGLKIIRIGTNTTSTSFKKCERFDRDLVCDTWLRDCHTSQEAPELNPRYMLHTSSALKEVFAAKFDIFGDSYTKPFASLDEFDNILEDGKAWEEMSLNSDGDLSDGQVCDVEEDLLSEGEDLAWSVFKRVVAQLVSLDPSDACELALARARLTAGGAMISPSSDHVYAVTHIVVVGSTAGDPQQSPDWLSAEDMATVHAALPSTEPYTHKRRREQGLATDWVVVSTAWVKASMSGV
jgi:hypothetical protein